MVIKYLVHIAFLLLAITSFGQTEEQLKFSVSTPDEFKAFITSSPQIGELKSLYHSKNNYSDIYLDTPDQILLKNNLSLRFRKRIFDDSLNTVTYSMQLKNEMTTTSSIRMEVEEPELDFYFIQNKGNKISLTTLLETIFSHYKANPTKQLSEGTTTAIALIEQWIIDKAEAPVAPFQKLRALKEIQLKEIKNLKLVTCGSANRYRSHIYIDDETSARLNIPKNKIKSNKLPIYFLQNTTDNWLLETSFDKAVFYTIGKSPTKRVELVEYEVEQKHYDKTASKAIFELFKSEISQQYIITPKFDSKYKQMQLYFRTH